MPIFTHNRIFRIWSYTISHKWLIIRGNQTIAEGQDDYHPDDFNVDIEFTGVCYLQMPSSFDGLSISEIGISEKHELASYNGKIFKLNNETQTGYIVADGFIVGKNKWFGKDRIHDMGLKHDEILAEYY